MKKSTYTFTNPIKGISPKNTHINNGSALIPEPWGHSDYT